MSDSQDVIASHLSLLNERSRRAVQAALTTSAAQGVHVSAASVRLLVDFARGEITSQQYVQGILAELGAPHDLPSQKVPVDIASAKPAPADPVPDAPDTAISDTSVTKATVVDAFVSGRIGVEEFLRIARR